MSTTGAYWEGTYNPGDVELAKNKSWTLVGAEMAGAGGRALLVVTAPPLGIALFAGESVHTIATGDERERYRAAGGLVGAGVMGAKGAKDARAGRPVPFRRSKAGSKPPIGEACLDPSRYRPYVSRQKQARHVAGTMEWRRGGRGGYFKTHEDAQAVLNAARNGNATLLGANGKGFPVVQYHGVTGFNNNPRAGYMNQPTNIFVIKGTNKPSVVPISPVR